jgi:predicted nuclease of predicted toxin-antitoxin system
MRFLLDENTPHDFALALRNEGHDVVWIPETRLRGLDDPAIWALGREEQRVLVTADLDFPTLGTYEPGMIVVRKIDRLSTSAQADLVLAVVRAEGDNLRGQLAVVAPGRVRMRRL